MDQFGDFELDTAAPNNLCTTMSAYRRIGDVKCVYNGTFNA